MQTLKYALHRHDWTHLSMMLVPKRPHSISLAWPSTVPGTLPPLQDQDQGDPLQIQRCLH